MLTCKRGKTPCLTRIRIRTVEPGFQERVCPSCGESSWFELRPTTQVKPGPDGEQIGLRFQWADEADVKQQVAEFLIGQAVDIGIARNQP